LIDDDSSNANIEYFFSFESSIKNDIIVFHWIKKYEERMNDFEKESNLRITKNQFLIWIVFEWHLFHRVLLQNCCD
jgi:hypothetical protein